MKVVAYVRVSTEEQAAEGLSLGAQRQQIEAYARLYELDVVGWYEDAGFSGSRRDRPALWAALAAVTLGNAEGLVVAKLDRLTRSLPHLLELMEEYFQRDVALMSVAEQLDPRTASGRLVMNILGSVAQWERETISERTKAALAWKRMNGEYTGGGVPYGFRVDHCGRLRRNMWEARAIDVARQLADGGASLRQIGKALTMDGMYPRGGGEWSAQQVKRLLENETNEGGA